MKYFASFYNGERARYSAYDVEFKDFDKVLETETKNKIFLNSITLNEYRR